MTPTADKETALKDAIAKVVKSNNSDIVLINGEIERPIDRRIIDSVSKNKAHKNVFVILVTPGGDADAAYRLTRCFQDQYDHFTLFVSGYCKSAGTLCALGANELVISDFGELGPLDVQVRIKDEIGERSSGLVVGEALKTLQAQAFSLFETHFLEIKNRSFGQVTFKTATEIAAQISVGLFSRIYRQIDPLQIGEIARSMTIAKDYGKRLQIKGCNSSDEALSALVESYPSHGFVIDRREAMDLFTHVRPPREEEENLAVLLGMRSRIYRSRDPETGIAFEVDFLSKHVAKPKETHDETKDRDTTTDAPKGTGGHEGDPAKPADPKAAGAPRAGKTVLPIRASNKD